MDPILIPNRSLEIFFTVGFRAFLVAVITAALIDLITKQNKSNLLTWMGWFVIGFWISIIAAFLFSILLWLNPSLIDNTAIFYLMVVFTSTSLTVVVYWEGLISK